MPQVMIRDRVTKTVMTEKQGNASEKDVLKEETEDTVEKAREELKFINAAGEEINPDAIASSKVTEIKTQADSTKEKAEKAADEEDDTASVVIVRNE